MSFLAKPTGSQYLGAFVGLIAVSLLVRATLAGGIEDLFDPSTTIENRIEQSLTSSPGDLAVLAAIEHHFPLDYDDLLEAMGDSAVADASDAQVAAEGRRQLSLFLGRHLNDFAAAPSPELRDVLHGEGEALKALKAENPAACSAYVFATGEPITQVSDRTMGLIGQTTALKIGAMAAGRADPQLRLAVTPQDAEALAASLKTLGASDAQITVLTQGLGSSIVDISPAELCDAALLMLDAIAVQDAGVRDLLIGSLLAPTQEGG